MRQVAFLRGFAPIAQKDRAAGSLTFERFLDAMAASSTPWTA